MAHHGGEHAWDITAAQAKDAAYVSYQFDYGPSYILVYRAFC